MNLKLKAAGITAALIVSVVLLVEVLGLVLANFTKEQLANGFQWTCMGILVFCMYKLVLLQLELRKTDK